MKNYELGQDEVLLHQGTITSDNYKGFLQFTLTSHRIILEKEKGLFKKEIELVNSLPLTDIKFYNEEVQIKNKGTTIEIQAKNQTLTLIFSGILEAKKVTTKLIDATTGTTLAKRVSDKAKAAFNIADETLGFDTRETLKGVLENGVKGTILNGIKKKK